MSEAMKLHPMARLLVMVSITALLVVSSNATACTVGKHRAGAAPLKAKLTSTKQAKVEPLWAGPAHSGSWYDPARSGEGIIVEYLADGTVLAFWFTYPAGGESGQQAWLITGPGRVEGSRVRFDEVYRPTGAIFGSAFNPAAVTQERWGTLELEVRDCSTLVVRYVGPAAFGSGERALTKLTHLDQLNCSGGRSLTSGGARSLDGLKARSGAWFVPSRSGEGWIVEDLPNGAALVYWFTYDLGGRQAWITGVGTRTAGRIEVTDLLITRGTRFGAGFNAADVERVPWGRLTLDFADCNQVDVTYVSTQPGYGSGSHRAVRLTALAGAPCVDGTPRATTQVAWSEEAALPGPGISELAATALDGKLYAMGGFGDPRGFKGYDPATRTWETLPQMPAGRDHHAAFAIDGGVYVVGGAANGDGDQSTAAFRYDVAARRWDTRPELQFGFGSHAAVLNGRAYIGDDDGSLQEYDPRSRVVRRIAASTTPAAPRDHSQVVAFMGEIWMIGGRIPETTTVAIYDPVTERWRAGPSLQRARGGFAAAVAGNQILVGGGEILFQATRTEGTVEVIAAGENAWQMAPRLPLSVHGVAGTGTGGTVYSIGGATVAASASNSTQRVFSMQLAP